jgi:S-DNA-T family DNA segregation ATPase FtsK/SpoIIIE
MPRKKSANKRSSKQQTSHRGWGDVLGLLFISLGLLLLVALISYEPADLPQHAAPPNPIPENWIGRFGAHMGYGLFFVFGAAAFLIPVLLLGFGLAHFVPILMYLMHSWRARSAATGLIISCMGMLDLFDASLGKLTQTIGSHSAGGLIGQILNDKMIVFFFNRTGAIIIYFTFYLVSLVAITNFDVSAWLHELWERYKDRRDRLDPEISVEERTLHRKARALAKQARELQEEAAKSGLGVDGLPVPEPTVRDLSISNGNEMPAKRGKKSKEKDKDPALMHVGDVIHAGEVKGATTEDILGKSSTVEDEGIGEEIPASSSDDQDNPSNPPSAPKAVSQPYRRPSKKKQPIRVAVPPVIGDYHLPTVKFLNEPDKNLKPTDSKEELVANARLMQNTLGQFGIEVSLGDITKGPTITRYELHPAPGIKLEKIANLSNNITAALKAERINILAPIPGKSSVGVEVPNAVKTKVIMRDLLESDEWDHSKARIPVVLGKDVYGKPIVADLADMPHLLIAGSTGSGKSVCINAIIASLLYRFSPEELRLVMIDPKVVELQQYNVLPHLVVPVVTDPKKVVLALRWVVSEMEKRYQIFAKVGVRNIASFNSRPKDEPKKEQQELPLNQPVGEDGNVEGFAVEIDEEIAVPREEDIVIPEKLSYIVVVIDELADLMLVAPADVEMAIARITQMARAAGIHCIVATQRPSVDVITGVIKANIPARIAFQVASKIDSRTILDSMGADKLLGKGDMLYLPPGSAKLIRAQGVLITDQEIQKVVDHIAVQGKPNYEMEIHEKLSKQTVSSEESECNEDEELIEKCIDVIRSEQRASVSLMQRRLRLGYTRAARIMDELERRGIVGPGKGAEPREILIDLDGGGADGGGQELV